MCGFVGTLSVDTHALVDRVLLESLAKISAHRGPDESGSHIDGNYGAAHQRLRIIDLTSAGKQPMQNTRGDISLCYNGEVYNVASLRKKYSLDSKFQFRSKTDTEVLLYLYELLGIEFLHELNGMFAFSLWDGRSKTLFLARDRFGIKPLFYTSAQNGDFYFASEIKSLLGIPNFKREPCLEAIHHYLSLGYIPGELTAFQDIKEVLPGYYMTIKGYAVPEYAKTRYWEPSFGNASEKSNTLDNIKELLSNSVKSQLISDVPVGVMLSGGLDSSTIAYFTSAIIGRGKLNTFSIGFDEKTFDESTFADLVAKHLGTIHHKILITPTSIIQNIESCISSIDEPYADGSAIPTYLLAQEAKKYVTVLLSGEGGDEVFGGYETYLAYFAKKLYSRLPSFIDSLFRFLAAKLPTSHDKLALSFKIKRFFSGVRNSVPTSHYKWREIFSEDEKRELLTHNPHNVNPSSSLFVDRFNEITDTDDLNKLLGIDSTYFLPDDLMIKNDRMTMAHSIEARVPFTDLVLFEYMAKLSGATKVRNFKLKYLLKKVMTSFLPRDVIKKKKVGLEIPYSKWFCGELKEFLLSHLSKQALKDIPIINSSYVQTLIQEHLALKADRGRELWSILNLVFWYKIYFIDKESRSDSTTT